MIFGSLRIRGVIGVENSKAADRFPGTKHMVTALSKCASGSDIRCQADEAHSIDDATMLNLLSSSPVMPATVLALELLVQEHSVDLRSVAELLGHDRGATACVFQSFLEDEPDVRPRRLVDAISRFEMSELLEMLATHMNRRGTFKHSPDLCHKT